MAIFQNQHEFIVSIPTPNGCGNIRLSPCQWFESQNPFFMQFAVGAESELVKVEALENLKKLKPQNHKSPKVPPKVRDSELRRLSKKDLRKKADILEVQWKEEDHAEEIIIKILRTTNYADQTRPSRTN